MRLHTIVYAVFVVSILFDLATSILCFQVGGLAETNLIYQIVGVWAFPIVYLFDMGVLLIVEGLRKHSKHVPTILFVPIFFYINAGATNLQLIL